MLRHQVYVTNTTACRPPNNDLGGYEGAEAKRRCSPGFKEELEFLRREGVRVLVPLGNEALEALGIEEKIGRARGSVYLRDGFIVVPTWHPSFIQRSQHKKDGASVTYKYVWLADLRKAKDLAEKGNWQPPKERFILRPSVDQVLAWIDRALADDVPVAVDIETSGISADRGTTVVIGLARDAEEAISIPFFHAGSKKSKTINGHLVEYVDTSLSGTPYWINGDNAKVREALEKLFARGKLIFQNALFDVRFLRGDGFKISFEAVLHDTLILHHAVSPELPHRLDFIVSVYGDTPYWKGEAKERKGRILDADEDELWTYNLRDTVVLFQVLPGLLEDLHELGPGAEETYYNESIPLLAPIAEMTDTGVLLDPKELLRVKTQWEVERDTAKETLQELARFPEGFNLESDDDIRWFLFGIEPAKFAKIAELASFEAVEGSDKKPRRKGTKVHADLVRLQGIRDRTIPPYRLSTYQPRRTAKTKVVAVDKQGLLGLTIALQNRLEAVRTYKDPRFKEEARGIEALLQWIKVFRDYRGVKKLISTYTKYPTGDDGRVHTQFLLHGTATGRPSSRKPNLLNIPKKRLEARNPFISAPGRKLISADYIGLEVLVLAYETGDQSLIDILESGKSLHEENTKVLFNLTPADEGYDLAKRAAKIFQFGGISYGGSDKEIHEKVVLEVPDLTLTMSAYRKAKARWLEAHPGYAIWAAKQREEVHVTRKATTFMGRVRTLHGSDNDIEKQALNTPIQGGAAHIMNRATIALWKSMRRREMKSRIVLQIYDQLVVEAPDDEVEEAKALLMAAMEAPVDYRGRAVVFHADMEVGTSWGHLTAPDNDVDESDDEEEEVAS
jgi:DNA polymerase I-like protein with 3'-5' exonuclease and polymerase domains